MYTMSKVNQVEDALEDGFSLSESGIPEYISIEETSHGNVKITYKKDADEDVGQQLNRYFIGNLLRSSLDASIEHDVNGNDIKTFVRW